MKMPRGKTPCLMPPENLLWVAPCLMPAIPSLGIFVLTVAADKDAVSWLRYNSVLSAMLGLVGSSNLCARP